MISIKSIYDCQIISTSPSTIDFWISAFADNRIRLVGMGIIAFFYFCLSKDVKYIILNFTIFCEGDFI